MEAPTLSWEKLKPASGTAPSARSGHTMTMVGEKLYVFGGCGLAEGIGHLAGTTGSMHVFDTGRSLFIRSFSLLVCIIFATDIFY